MRVDLYATIATTRRVKSYNVTINSLNPSHTNTEHEPSWPSHSSSWGNSRTSYCKPCAWCWAQPLVSQSTKKKTEKTNIIVIQMDMLFKTILVSDNKVRIRRGILNPHYRQSHYWLEIWIKCTHAIVIPTQVALSPPGSSLDISPPGYHTHSLTPG